MRDVLRPCLVIFLLLSLATGVVYPLVVHGIAQTAFAHQANGSLIRDGEAVRGSALIGQPFVAPGYFWARPSATSRVPYDAAASSGSNKGPTNPALLEEVSGRVSALRESVGAAEVPIDLVTTSGSGLDPHISPASAFLQVERVAKARGRSTDTVRALVERHVELRQLGLFGEPRVNILRLNLALDRSP